MTAAGPTPPATLIGRRGATNTATNIIGDISGGLTGPEPDVSPAAPVLLSPGGGPVLGSLCTGYGGLDLAVAAVRGARLGWCADPDPRAAAILRARAPGVPNLGDITALDWNHVPAVEVLTAGFPCQDISDAGRKTGIQKGNRSGLWITVINAVRHLRPPLVLLENVAALRWPHRGMGVVLGDLAAAGYDTRWSCLPASAIGAPHRRERVFILAYPTDHPPHPLTRPEPTASTPPPPEHPDGPVPLLPTPLASNPSDGETPQHWRDRRARRGRPTSYGMPLSIAVRDTPQCLTGTGWGRYTPAIRRWEHLTGHPAPNPTWTTRTGRTRLTPRLVEWMMGLPEGWVTDLPLSATAQHHALGNGVVPQQAMHALHELLALQPAQIGRHERAAA